MPNITEHWTRQGSGWKLELQQAGAPISWLYVIDRPLRLGGCVVRHAGIGGVWTEPDHRGQGHAARCLAAAVRHMTEQGYPLSLLFGIPDFYHRFGYEPVFPSTTVDVSVAALARSTADSASTEFVAGPMTPDDRRSIRDLYETMAATRPLAAVRGDDWPGFRVAPDWRPAEALVVRRRATGGETLGAVAGYAAYRVRETTLVVSELAVATPSAWPVLFQGLAKWAHGSRCEHLELHLPPDDPALAFLRPVGFALRVCYHANADALGRILRLPELLQAVAPMLAARSRAAGLSGRLRLSTDLGEATVVLDPQAVSVSTADGEVDWRVRLNQGALLQLLVGYRPAEAVATDAGAVVPEPALPVLQALFPPGEPYLWWADRF